MTKPSLWTRVKASIKGGEEKDVVRFELATYKKVEKEINDRKNQVSDLEDKIADAKDSLNDKVFEIDLSSIKGIDNAKSYTSTYLGNIDKALSNVETYQEQIDTLNLEIKRYEDIKNIIENATPKVTGVEIEA